MWLLIQECLVFCVGLIIFSQIILPLLFPSIEMFWLFKRSKETEIDVKKIQWSKAGVLRQIENAKIKVSEVKDEVKQIRDLTKNKLDEAKSQKDEADKLI